MNANTSRSPLQAGLDAARAAQDHLSLGVMSARTATAALVPPRELHLADALGAAASDHARAVLDAFQTEAARQADAVRQTNKGLDAAAVTALAATLVRESAKNMTRTADAWAEYWNAAA